MTRRVENAVILTGSDATLLYETAHLRELRTAARGKSDRLHALLTDIMTAAITHRASVEGRNPWSAAESDEPSSGRIVTVNQVAKRAGVTARTVRNHIDKNLLAATKINRVWIITKDAAQQYIDGRTAA